MLLALLRWLGIVPEEPEPTAQVRILREEHQLKVKGLLEDNERLQAELAVSRLTNELLADLNEQMRIWVKANTAAGVAMALSHGAPPSSLDSGNIREQSSPMDLS